MVIKESSMMNGEARAEDEVGGTTTQESPWPIVRAVLKMDCHVVK